MAINAHVPETTSFVNDKKGGVWEALDSRGVFFVTADMKKTTITTASFWRKNELSEMEGVDPQPNHGKANGNHFYFIKPITLGSQRNLNADRPLGGWFTFKFIVEITRNPHKKSGEHFRCTTAPASALLSSGPHPAFNACFAHIMHATPPGSADHHNPERRGVRRQGYRHNGAEADSLLRSQRGGGQAVPAPEGGSPRSQKRGGNYHQLLRKHGQKRKDSENGFGQTGGSADLSLEQDRSRRRPLV